MFRPILLSLVATFPTLAFGSEPPERYVQDRWRHTRDHATVGLVIGGLGVATAATGIALREEESVPSGVMIGTGTAAMAGGATVASVVALNQRYEFLDRENSAAAGALSLGLVGLSGISMLGAVVTGPDASVHDAFLYGGAGLGAAGLLVGGAQLASNAATFKRRQDSKVSWAPVVTPKKVGLVVVF